MLLAEVTAAGVFPDVWKGIFEVEQSLPGHTEVTYRGEVPITVSPAGIKGEADLPFKMNTNEHGCKTVAKGFHVMKLTGKLAKQGAGKKGEELQLQGEAGTKGINGTITCSNPPSTNPLHVPDETHKGKLTVPLKDGAGPNGPIAIGGTTVDYKMTLATPCPKWDSEQTPGPKYEFSPDPNDYATPIPEHGQYTSKQLTDIKHLTSTPKEVLFDEALGSEVLGMARVNFAAIKLDTKITTSKPRIKFYKECVAVEEVKLKLPIDSMVAYVASEIDFDTDRDCYDQVEEHERQHILQARAAMRNIATEVEAKIKSQNIPGPYNALPSVTTGSKAVEEQVLKQLVDEIVKKNEELWKKDSAALDKKDRPTIKKSCKRY
jgi:hypothetical protein